jgi:hypothetical protein
LTVQEYGYTCIFEIYGIGEWRFSCEQGEHGSAKSARSARKNASSSGFARCLRNMHEFASNDPE